MSRTSYTTRFSYAASDVAGQLVFCVVSFYLSYFYTDVFGIPAATAGMILLIARWVDAIDAPLWGIIFDRTRSRWGKSRPWFLWLCLSRNSSRRSTRNSSGVVPRQAGLNRDAQAIERRAPGSGDRFIRTRAICTPTIRDRDDETGAHFDWKHACRPAGRGAALADA